MKVFDIMHKKVETIGINDTVKDAARLIFGRSINGLPVIDKKKIVGFITEKDILSKFYPTAQEYMEDIVHTSNFEDMESKVSEILALPVREIMNTKTTTIKADTPILHAQSLMNLKKIGRLPVVNDEGHLIGILTKGDIFQAIVARSLPAYEEEGFYNWMSEQYDVFNDWKIRLPKEIPYLVKLFNKNKVKRVLDIASSTGEHSIALAKSGFDVVGIEKSPLINKVAEEKRNKLSDGLQKKLSFFQGDYNQKLGEIKDKFDAVIFMGNGLPHVTKTDPDILDAIKKSLTPNGVIVCQIINFKKVLRESEGLWAFARRKLNPSDQMEIASLDFYSKEGDKITYSHTFFDFDGKIWSFKGMNSTIIDYFDKKKITNKLKKLGFKKITFYGASKMDILLKNPFNERQSDWLNVVAKR